MDVAWFIPAFCLSDDHDPFRNKYGETVSAEYLVLALLRQRNASPRHEQPCGGMHGLQALAYAAKYLGPRLSPQLRERLRATWQRERGSAMQLIDANGRLDIHTLLGVDASKGIADSAYVQVAGHLLESLFICDSDGETGMDDGIDRFVSYFLDRVEQAGFMKDTIALMSSDPRVVPTYGDMAHLVHGLRLYAGSAGRHGSSP